MSDAICRQLLPYLPPNVGQAVMSLPEAGQGRLEELRFRRGCELTAVIGGVEQPLSLERPLLCSDQTLQFLLNAASGYSAYAAGEALRQGFLPLRGGHRLGFCGTAVLEQGEILALHELSSANLRVARACHGCADEALRLLGDTPGSVLIAGPPGSGKTTLLRELVRLLSDRLGRRVGVVDSRGELAACLNGEPQFAVGRRTDVISMAPKAQGLELLLRVMSPEWIAVDEITAGEDVRALNRAGYCGVRLLATVHAFGPADLKRRPLYKKLLDEGMFDTVLSLDRQRQIKLERMEKLC